MNHNSVSQSPVSNQSIAFQFGVRDAKSGNARDPKTVFSSDKEQREYAAGVESVNGKPSKPMMAHYRRDGGEYLRITDLAADKEIEASIRQDKRHQRMYEATVKAGFDPSNPCDLLLAA